MGRGRCRYPPVHSSPLLIHARLYPTFAPLPPSLSSFLLRSFMNNNDIVIVATNTYQLQPRDFSRYAASRGARANTSFPAARYASCKGENRRRYATADIHASTPLLPPHQHRDPTSLLLPSSISISVLGSSLALLLSRIDLWSPPPPRVFLMPPVPTNSTLGILCRNPPPRYPGLRGGQITYFPLGENHAEGENGRDAQTQAQKYTHFVYSSAYPRPIPNLSRRKHSGVLSGRAMRSNIRSRHSEIFFGEYCLIKAFRKITRRRHLGVLF